MGNRQWATARKMGAAPTPDRAASYESPAGTASPTGPRRNALWLLPLAHCLLLALLPACNAEPPPSGLATAEPTAGPKIVFDLAARPIPEIPFPNDIATRPDPTSPTGRRLNAALIAPTELEASA